jgi:hypothetical protein
MLKPSSIVSRNVQVQLAETEVDREAVMLRLDTGICYGLNKVGTVLWQQITGPVTIAEICAALLARYDIDAETCERQVLELLGEMQAEDLISVAEH